MFMQGTEYKRRDIHASIGGQAQGGISTPVRANVVLIFTGDTGKHHGYSDSWTPDGVFLYTGEGQVGDMEFVRGNAAIRDHVGDGKDLHLFEATRRGFVRYSSQMVCIGHQFGSGPDSKGKTRRTIVFQLCPVQELVSQTSAKQAVNESLPLSILRKKALEGAGNREAIRDRKTSYYVRSEAIKLYALKRAAGVCEGCGKEAPFRTSAGQPYLEVHHIRRLSDGGPDDPRWVAAICPNCHRRSHFSADAQRFNDNLRTLVIDREKNLDR